MKNENQNKPQNSYYNHLNFRKEKFMLRQKMLLQTLEAFAHSIYTFGKVNKFINIQNEDNSNYWKVEDHFDLFDPIFTLMMIEDERDKSTIQDMSYMVATNELQTLHDRSLKSFKSRTAIIIEAGIRNYLNFNDAKKECVAKIIN